MDDGPPGSSPLVAAHEFFRRGEANAEGVVKSATGGYALGFVLMALVALACLLVLRTVGRA